MSGISNQIEYLNPKEQSIISVIADTPLEETPTQNQLATQAGMSKPTLNKWLRVLIEHGIVQTENAGKGRSQKYLIADIPKFNFQNENPASYIDINRYTESIRSKKTTTVIKSKSIVTSNTSYKEILEKKKIKKSINSFIASGGFSKKIAEKLKTFPAKLSRSGSLYFKIEEEWMLASKVENRYINKRYWSDGNKFHVSGKPQEVRFEYNPIYGCNQYNLDWSQVELPKHTTIHWGDVEAIAPLKGWQYDLVYTFHEKLQETPFKRITIYQVMRLFREFEAFGEWFGSKLMYLINGFTGATKKIYNAYKYIRACVWRGIRGDNGEEQMHMEFWEDARRLERNRAIVEGYGGEEMVFHKIAVPRLKWSMSLICGFEMNQAFETVREFYRELGLRFLAHAKFVDADWENMEAVEGYSCDTIDKQALRTERNRWKSKLDNLWRLFMHEKPEWFGDYNFFIPSVEGY